MRKEIQKACERIRLIDDELLQDMFDLFESGSPGSWTAVSRLERLARI